MGQPQNRLPSLWLMTDERIDDATLFAALARLPRGAGVVFRHYGLPPVLRRALFNRVRAATRRRGVTLLLAGSARQAVAWRAHGWHGRTGGHPTRPMLHSAPVHSIAEMRAAERHGTDILFFSPLFPTSSHPGAPALGRARFGLCARQARRPIIALGGITPHRARSLKRIGASGWAAIDALSCAGNFG